METRAFSDEDILFSISAKPKSRIEISSLKSDGELTSFIPPAVKLRDDEAIWAKLGVDKNTFERIRRGKEPGWTTVRIDFYSSAIGVQYERTHEEPVSIGYSSTFQGIRIEQTLTETIPYDNISPGEFSLRIDNNHDNGKSLANWLAKFTKESLDITTPAEMDIHITRTHL